MIKNIKIENLYQHPNNPRKDLGDLTELAASIKENGVMQNLTVVPWVSKFTRQPGDKGSTAGDYTIIIGHRRFAAAKLAGLKELPCSIVEMSDRQQVATMLLENMQRADLTVYEQANGFQMMLDLGDTVSTIAQQTGFSETTVRNRVKLMELDKDKFKASQERGATLMDYIHLSEITNLKTRNEVLETVGTNDFQFKLRGAIFDQKAKQYRPLIKKELESFATLIKNNNTQRYEYVSSIRLIDYEPGKLIPKDAGKKKYYFTWDDKNSYGLALYKELAKKQASRRPQEEIDFEKAVHDAEAKLKDLTSLAYETRFEFIKNISIKRNQMPEILEFLCKAVLFTGTHYRSFYKTSFQEALDLNVDQYATGIRKEYFNAYYDNPLKVAFISAWATLGDSKETGYYHINYGRRFPDYQKNESLDMIYGLLECFGYEMSEEEKALADGTHEIFPETTKEETTL